MKHKALQFQTVKPILRSTLERLMTIDDIVKANVERL